MNLTAANQLTLLRMLLIPPFVILLLYGHRGWALTTFVAAGITDGDYRFAPVGAGDEEAPGKGLKREAIQGSFLHTGPGRYQPPPRAGGGWGEGAQPPTALTPSPPAAPADPARCKADPPQD